MSRRQVDQEIEKALSVWTEYTDLTFTQKRSGKVHIDISFLKGEHGDGDPFDGSGGTLAHAFFPVFGGDAHFDDAENWTKGSFRGESALLTHSLLYQRQKIERWKPSILILGFHCLAVDKCQGVTTLHFYFNWRKKHIIETYLSVSVSEVDFVSYLPFPKKKEIPKEKLWKQTWKQSIKKALTV